MKTVFSTSEIPHLWANKGADYGRSASALSFQYAVLRSYSTDIGHVLESGRAVVLNLTSYSNTTAKHQSAMRDAVRHYPIQFPVVGLDRGEVLRRLTGREIVDNITAQAVELSAKSLRARSNAEHFRVQAEELARIANAGLEYFKIRRKPLDLANLAHAGAQLSARQKAAANKQAKVDAARRAEWLASLQLKLNDWKSGELPSRGWWNFSELPVALRLVTDEDGRLVVETSRGASVLLCQALRLFKLCQGMKERGTSWGPENMALRPERFAVGPYALQQIDSQGNAQVGCHSLSFAEMERLFLSLSPEQIEQASKVQEVANA